MEPSSQSKAGYRESFWDGPPAGVTQMRTVESRQILTALSRRRIPRRLDGPCALGAASVPLR